MQQSYSTGNVPIRDMMNQALAAFPNKHDAEKLLDSLFLYAEANYYYFDERDLRSRIQRLYDRQSPENVDDLDLVALALVSFALGSQFIQFNGILLQVAEISAEDTLPGARFMYHAERIMPLVMTNCSNESLQCCLLMAICLLPTAGPKASYIYLSVALKIAISLGLHRAPGRSPSEQTLQRVFWTTYVIER
jgi:hypothetical protein